MVVKRRLPWLFVNLGTAFLAAAGAGAVIPLLLKGLGQDPAQSAAIFLTTVTDIVGFAAFLGLATLLSAMIL
jgi:magnesium transporter